MHIIFIRACAQNVRLQHERKRIDADATRQQHIQQGSVWLRASFQFVNVQDLGTIDSLLINVK